MNEIPNNKLTKDSVPLQDAPWSAIRMFALSFDGYAKWGSHAKCADIANKSLDAWRENEQLPNSLADLRTCLFFEQRRWTHFGGDPDEKTMIYIHSLLEAIEKKIIAGELD